MTAIPVYTLPAHIKLDPAFFDPATVNKNARVTVTAKSKLVSSRYMIPSTNVAGVLTNNGTGNLSWDPVDTIIVDDDLTDGTLKLIQNGTGDTSILFQNPSATYSLGIDPTIQPQFKLSKSSSLGTNDICIFDINNGLTLSNNLYLPRTTTDGTAGVLKIGECYFAELYDTTNLFIGEETNYYTLDGDYNICIGYYTSSSLTTGSENTIIGNNAGEYTDTGRFNTFVGTSAGDANTSGSANTFIGAYSAEYCESGSQCVSIGYKSGDYFSTDSYNVFVGAYSGYNAELDHNTCVGYASGYALSAADSTMIGAYAGYNSTTGVENTFVGYSAGYYNDDGYGNDYFGFETGRRNVSGWGNTVFGTKSLRAQNGGNSNTVVGYHSMITSTSVNSNTCIGYASAQSTNGSDNVIIGHFAMGNPSNTANKCVAIGGSISIANATINNRVCIGYGSTCSVDNGFILGDAASMVGIRNNSPTQPLDVTGNVKLSGVLKLTPQVAPASGEEGDIYYESGTQIIKVCTVAGTPGTWKTIAYVP